jgi:hypothetical protein
MQVIKEGIDKTLADRENTYGYYGHTAALSQSIKEKLREHRKWLALTADKKEALEMIAHKMARIMEGDPAYRDNWHDIAGYATLVERTLPKTKEGK